MVDFEKIKQAVKDRDDFIEANPQARELQNEIDELLRKAGRDHHARQVALQTFMLNTWFKIVEAWEGKK